MPRGIANYRHRLNGRKGRYDSVSIIQGLSLFMLPGDKEAFHAYRLRIIQSVCVEETRGLSFSMTVRNGLTSLRDCVYPVLDPSG